MFKSPGVVAHGYRPSYLGGWGTRTAWTREAQVAVSRDCAIALQPGWQNKNLSVPSVCPQKKQRKKKKLKSFIFHTWWARQIKSKSWRFRNLLTTSAPKVKETPRSFSPQPCTSLSGSDHSKSQSKPLKDRNTAIKNKIYRFIEYSTSTSNFSSFLALLPFTKQWPSLA